MLKTWYKNSPQKIKKNKINLGIKRSFSRWLVMKQFICGNIIKSLHEIISLESCQIYGSLLTDVCECTLESRYYFFDNYSRYPR